MKAAVCLIVKNEDDCILEWLLHYANIGFYEAIVYDNGSTDRTAEFIGRYGSKFRCRYIYWTPDCFDPQLEAYDDCVNRFKNDFDWIAFFDIDEILIPPSGETINDFVSSFEDADAIGLNWLMFGSNGRETKNPHLMMEAFTARAPLDFPPNRNTKTIVRPTRVTGPCNNPHWFPVEGERLTVNRERMIWDPAQEGVVDADKIVQGSWRLHHYYTRGTANWRKRVARGQFGSLSVTPEHFAVHDRNDVVDESALPFARAVRASAIASGLPLAGPDHGGEPGLGAPPIPTHG